MRNLIIQIKKGRKTSGNGENGKSSDCNFHYAIYITVDKYQFQT